MKEKDFNVIEKNLEASKSVCKPFSQSFKSVVPTYQLDQKNHRLVESGFRDVQKEIDSHRSCALDVMLDKFLDFGQKFNDQYQVVDTDEIVEFNNGTLDLAELGEALELADCYRSKYGLPLSMEPKEVFKYVKSKEFEISSKIKNLKDIEVKDNEN